MEAASAQRGTGSTTRSSLEDFVVITGFSGAGKSTVMNVFEDAGYFCVDNLPPEMIRSLVELFMHEGSKVERAAVVCDLRAGAYFDALIDALDQLDDMRVNHHLVFLKADEQTLITRYQETRRRHPVSPAGTVTTGIHAEADVLAPLERVADLVVDTTGLTAGILRRRIVDEVFGRQSGAKLAVTFQSFGFKHGPPRGADLVFDVRFLPNPHYVPGLRLLTGHDERVVEYIARGGTLNDFYARLLPLLEFVIPQYVAEGKAHLTIAIGCTGGRHRSVAITEALGARFGDEENLWVDVTHRDVTKAPLVQ